MKRRYSPVEHKNARFWQWVNDGWVKLTLKPYQSLHHCVSGPCDEGWFREANLWHHQGDRVVTELHSAGADCDGRHEYHYEGFCLLTDLGSRDADFADGIKGAPWTESSRVHYDQYAEMAGY